MSFYGTKRLSDIIILEKRRFPPNNTLRFGNVNLVVAYDPETLAPIHSTKDSTAYVVAVGSTDCVTVAIGPYSDALTNFQVIDTPDNITLDPGLNCVVLEGLVEDETGNVFDSKTGIPHFVTLTEPVKLHVKERAKLLVFEMQ